jgi:hypothetical protein
MSRAALVLAISCVTASLSFAKDLCIQVDTSSYAGSQVVMKKVKLSHNTAGPIQGYLARYNPATLQFGLFYPIDGQSIVNAIGVIALGIALHDVAVESGGSSTGSGPGSALSLSCQPGSDGKLNVLDTCSGFVSGQSAVGHVIPCKDVVPIP